MFSIYILLLVFDVFVEQNKKEEITLLYFYKNQIQDYQNKNASQVSIIWFFVL